MKRNVILFSFLALGVLYIWFGMEEKLLEEIELKSSSPDEKPKPKTYHTRKLLFHTSIGSESEDIDIFSTPVDTFEYPNFETRRNKISHSSRESGKISRRRKRRTQNSKEQLAWKFNLNVTRYENPKNTTQYPTERKDTHEKSKKDKYLGMSLSVSGNGPDQSLEELYQAWDSVGQFLRSLFGGNLEELKDKGHGVSIEMSALPNGTKGMPPVEFFLDGSGDEDSQNGKKREGKFILGIFGFGGNNENPPRDEGSGETLDEQEFNGTEVSLVPAIFTTEIPNSRKSVTSSSNLDDTVLTTNPTDIDITSSIPIDQEAFSEGNCTECKIETENASTDGKSSDEESSTSLSVLNTTTLEFPFKNEALADFCNTLFARLQKFPQSVERSVGNEGSGSVAMDESGVTINAQSSNILTDEPRPQNFGFFERIWNRIMGRKNVPIQEVMKESRGARLVNIEDLLGELGSGRELGVSSNFEFDNFQGGVTESEEDNEQFLSDCEAFFMSVQTDTRPNIFDLIHPHPEEEIVTEFTTLKSDQSQLNVHGTVSEQALDFESTSKSEDLTVLPLISETDQPKTSKDELLNKTPSEVQFTTEAHDNRLLQESDHGKPFESSTKSDDKGFTEVEATSFDVRNLVEESMNISLELLSTQSSNLSFFTNMDENELSTEELNLTRMDEQRSFNLFGFGGSGADEGSADMSSFNQRTFGLFNFGSGERGIKENDVSAEHTTESFKERSFFPNFGSGGRELGPFNSSEWEVEEELNSTTESRGRFFLFGSGERELRETLETTTKTPDEGNKSRKLSNDSSTTECDDSVHNFNDSDVFIGPSETTTLKNDPRLIGTIFLTGSGEGGLFVDNKGPINLIQESEFTSPAFQKPPQTGRGGRKHDPEINIRTREQTERNFEVTEPLQLTSPKSSVTLQEFTGKNDVSTSSDEALDETTVVLPTIVENITSDPTTVDPKIIDEMIVSTSLVTSMSVTELGVTTSGVMITTSQKITPRTKVLELPKRFCSSASECNRALNERCIFSGTTAMCDCGRSYVRSPETGKCESPVVLKTSLKLPGEVFHQDLKNRNSARFQKKRNDSIETMMLLLGDDPDLFRTIAGVDVSGFEAGSLVVHWQITLAPNDTSIPSLIQQVDAELKEAFEDEALLEKAPLNVTNAVLMEVTSDMDPCENTERNYCSTNADCIPDPLRGFVCRCKDEYMDKSMDIGHPGEVCIASCHPYYCGDHGECSLKEDGNRHCMCNNLFFGERCEISGIIIIAGFASFNVVLIVVVIIVVCCCRKRRNRQSRFYGQNQVRFQNGEELGRFTASPRLADTIAMDDVGPTKTSKYMAISTPLHNVPTIQIKSPSIIGSSVDYDYESTFDRTPSAGEVSIEVHKMQETPQV